MKTEFRGSMLCRGVCISPAGALSFLKAIGGYNARVFTDQHRREVTELVLVDSAREGQWRELPIEVSEFKDAGLHQLYVGRVMASGPSCASFATGIPSHFSPG